MTEQPEWVKFSEIEWNDPKFNKFNVDTRDFHVGYAWKDEEHPDIKTLRSYPRFFFTEEELKKELRRLFEESGGEGEWRMIDLVSPDKRVRNWNLKYLRIWRTDLGFIICNQEDSALSKDLIQEPINQELLMHQ